MASKVLDCFSMLLRDKASDRIDGAAKLALYYLKTKKENEDSKEANHVLTRLVRGLGTSKASSRKGFYIAFHQILSNDSTITIDHIFSIMNTELKSSKSNSKSEVADINNGRILACGAMIRSGLLKTSSLEDQKKVLECLIHSGKQRSYLGFESMSFIVEFLNQFEDKDSLKPIWSVIEPEICKPISEQTLDTFYVILVILDKFPKIISKKTLKAQFGNENIINEESMKDIIKILTDIPRVICYKHPIYKIFTQKLVEANLVESFWLGIDQAFTRPSQTLQTVGIELFNLILANLKDKALISVLISPNFFKYMLKRFSYDPKHKKDDVAMNFKKALTELVTLLDKDVKTKVQINVLKKLIINPGDIMIEKVTGTKIIQILTNNLNADGVKKVASIYRDIATNTKFKEKDESESWSNCARIQVIQMLSVKLLGHKAVQQEKEWRVEQLKFLFEIGLCESSNIGVDLQSHFKESFYRALDNKLPKLDDLREVLTSLINFIDESVFKSSELKLRQPLEETATASWSKMLKLLKKLNKIDDQTGVVFHTMIMHMGLQLFFDPELAVTSIDDLQSCYEHVKLSKKKANDEPEWVEVVVDLILSLLSHKSHLLRSLVSCVFPHVCPHLNVQAMQQILEVLDVKSRKNPLKSNPDSDSEEEDESMDEDDEDNSDEEKNGDATNGNANNEDEEKEEDEEDSDSDESDEDDDESENDETLTDRLRLAVQSALGSAANPETDDAEDMDVDNIDEEEGKRLDESLAAAFRILKENRKRQSKKQEKDAQALTHFRTRVLDLLEMYFESEPSMALALDTLVPLFALLEFSIQDAHQRPLEMRVRGCLKKLSGVKKFKEIDVDGEVLTTILKALIEKGERSTMVCQEMGDKLAECCVFLVRCSQQIEGCTDSFVTIFCENLQAFFTQRSCALPSFLFKSLLQLCWVGNWKLAPLLVDYAFNQTLRKYRRGQALELLKVFFNNHRLMKLEEFASERESLEKKLGENITKSNTENLDLSKNTKTSLNKLAARIGVPIVLKRQAPQVDQDEASDSKKKKTTKED